MKCLLTKTLYILLLSFVSTMAMAEKYNIAVQPILPAKQIEHNYQPFVDYLADKTGHEFTITTYRNFLTYWVKMKRGDDMDFVIDAAHFTDFRIKRKDYKTVVKLPDTVTFTVVTSEENFIFDMDELILKRIATMPSPGLGAVKLHAMFPNPARLPFFIHADDSVDAINQLLDGSVDAAIIPSPMVRNYDTLNYVISTDPVPHMALSASATVPDNVVQAVKKALLDAPNTVEGRKMLSDMNFEYFEDVPQGRYAGYAELLDGVFGY